MKRLPGILPALLLAAGAASAETRTPEVGYCARLDEIEAVRAAGFDYAELRTSEIAALSESAFEDLRGRLKQGGPPVPVTYLFIPAEIKLTGPAADETRQMEYVQKAFARVSRLGTRTVVLGSGPARGFPEGFPKTEAFRQLVGFCRRIAPEARAHGITVAIEPQRRQECNLINSVAEGLELVRAVDDAAIGLTVDFYHVAEEKEDPGILVAAAPHVRHLHFANPEGRVFPARFEEYDYRRFFESLRSIGYTGRISIEARATDFAVEAPRAIAFLRSAFLP